MTHIKSSKIHLYLASQSGSLDFGGIKSKSGASFTFFIFNYYLTYITLIDILI